MNLQAAIDHLRSVAPIREVRVGVAILDVAIALEMAQRAESADQTGLKPQAAKTAFPYRKGSSDNLVDGDGNQLASFGDAWLVTAVALWMNYAVCRERRERDAITDREARIIMALIELWGACEEETS